MDKMLNLLKSALSLCYDRTPDNHDLDICIANCKNQGQDQDKRRSDTDRCFRNSGSAVRYLCKGQQVRVCRVYEASGGV